MNSIVVDPATLARLSQVAKTATLTDGQGRVVGHFIPAIDSKSRQALEPTIAEEELQRRERQGGGRPLADILSDLESRK